MKVRFRNKLESFVRCEEQLWPDCGGHLTLFRGARGQGRPGGPALGGPLALVSKNVLRYLAH